MGETHSSGARSRHRDRSLPRTLSVRTEGGFDDAGGMQPRARVRTEQSGETRRIQLLRRASGTFNFGLRRRILPFSAEGEIGEGGTTPADATFDRSCEGRGIEAVPFVFDFGGAEGGHHLAVRIPHPTSPRRQGEEEGDSQPRLEVGLHPQNVPAETGSLPQILPRVGIAPASLLPHGRIDAVVLARFPQGHTPIEGGVSAPGPIHRHDARSGQTGSLSLRHGHVPRRKSGADQDEGYRMAE
mmetsp:Transcript_39907/g.120122  ORF Transcript_39907/g.120122 Transcript_39907/m.120122 type:complete len:242 (-) Transcript_39907:507-1232(-)